MVDSSVCSFSCIASSGINGREGFLLTLHPFLEYPIVRVALCLAAVHGIPLHITRIRGNRSSNARSRPQSRATRGGGKGKTKDTVKRDSDTVDAGAPAGEGAGLKESHLAALRFLALHSEATVPQGDLVEAREVLFLPGTSSRRGPSGRQYHLNADRPKQKVPREESITLTNPGSAMLVLQAVLPFILFSDFLSRVECDCDSNTQQSAGDEHDNDKKRCNCLYTLFIHGGTNVSHSPSADYVQQVLLPTLDRTMGIEGVSVEVVKRGWAGSDPVVGMVRVRVRKDAGARKTRRNRNRSQNVIGRISITILAHTQTDRDDLGVRLLTLLPQQFPQDICPSRKFEVLSTNNTDHGSLRPEATKATSVPSSISTPGEHDLDLSNSPRNIYVLLVAHLTNTSTTTDTPTTTTSLIGADHLHSGRLPKTVAQRETMMANIADAVVRDLSREVARCGVDRDAMEEAQNGGGEEEVQVEEDSHMQDQLVIFRALEAVRRQPHKSSLYPSQPKLHDEQHNHDSKTRQSTLTLHAQTARWVCGQMLGVKFDERDGGCWVP